MRFFIAICLICPLLGHSANNDKKTEFTVSGIYGAVICKGHEINLKKSLPLPCEITTGKNSFLELTGNSNERLILGATSTVIINENLLSMKKGSIRIEGARELKISAYSHEVSRKAGKQLFFSSEVFSDLEMLSFDGEMVFNEKVEEEGKDKKVIKITIPKNSWVSIGGRFGNELGDFFELSKEQLAYFSSFLLPQSSE